MQDTHSNTSGKPNKRRNSRSVMQKCAREKNTKAHLHNLSRQNTIEDVTQAQLAAHQNKAVVSGQGQGCGRTAPNAPRPHLALAVAWRHAMAVPGCFLFFPCQTILTSLYKKRRSSFFNTQHHLEIHTSPLYLYSLSFSCRIWKKSDILV